MTTINNNDNQWPFDFSFNEAWMHCGKPVHVELLQSSNRTTIQHGLLYSIDPVTHTVFLTSSNNVSANQYHHRLPIMSTMLHDQNEDGTHGRLEAKDSLVQLPSLPVSPSPSRSGTSHWSIIHAHAIKQLILLAPEIDTTSSTKIDILDSMTKP
ncbi:hypothetical protein BDF19DRAFT_453383 [Syncephalis fuscata]|nr:hypothetical protein BDF19DRAFT_453383 [Syncephalis fuscata]